MNICPLTVYKGLHFNGSFAYAGGVRMGGQEQETEAAGRTEDDRKAMDLQYPVGLRWTRQRKNVYHVLREAEGPLTAVQIYHLAEAVAQGEEYAISTIYRILAAFEERDLVEKSARLEDGTAAYALKKGEHVHYAVCLECHRRIPLQNCPFAHIQIEKETGDFTVTSHKLELYGYCRECGRQRQGTGDRN